MRATVHALDAAGRRGHRGHPRRRPRRLARSTTASPRDRRDAARSRPAVEEATQAKIAVLLVPGIGTVDDLQAAPATPARSVARIATHCTEADVSVQHFGAARELGMETVGLPDDGPPDRRRRSWPGRPGSWSTPAPVRLRRRLGGRAACSDDAAGAGRGARRARSATRRRSASTATRTCRLGVANSVLAYQAGARQIDGALCALGAGAGNSPTEVLAATFDRLGVGTGVDVAGVLAAAEDVVRPYLDRAGRRWTATRSCRAGRASTRRSCCTPSAPPSATACPRTRSCSRVGELGLRRRPGGHDHRRRDRAGGRAGV